MNFSELQANQSKTQSIAIVGRCISGLACAWLLSRNHRVTVFEADARIGGHSHTVDARFKDAKIAVDTGFIVYKEPCYPNLTKLFETLGVATAPADMSFAVSLEGGARNTPARISPDFSPSRAIFLNPASGRCCATSCAFIAKRSATCRPWATTLDEYSPPTNTGRPFATTTLPMAAAIMTTPGRHPELSGCGCPALLRQSWADADLNDSGGPQWRTVRRRLRSPMWAPAERAFSLTASRSRARSFQSCATEIGGRTGRRVGRAPALRRAWSSPPMPTRR